MASHSYKLIYFNARGRGEIIRLLFAAAGIQFEDVRLSGDQIQALKPSLPFGQVPVLEIDGVTYAQSLGIATYLAREFGFYGQTNIDGLRIDEVVFHMSDMIGAMTRSYDEPDENRKSQLMSELREVKFPKGFGYLEKLLQKNGTGYFVGSEMTLADITIFDFALMMDGHGMVKLSQFPQIKKLIENVQSHHKLVNYLKKRQ